MDNKNYSRARASQSKATLDDGKQSACAIHVSKRNHVIDFNNASVLATHCNNKLGRKIRESIWVRSEPKGTFNRNEGGYELSRTWDALLQPSMTNSCLANQSWRWCLISHIENLTVSLIIIPVIYEQLIIIITWIMKLFTEDSRRLQRRTDFFHKRGI